jgi:seryl-tRNA synthetase
MLDINLIRENPDRVAQALKKRIDDIDFTELLAWDEKRRAYITEIGQLREKRNSVSAQIPQMKKAGEDTTQVQHEMRDVSTSIKTLETELSKVEQNIHTFVEGLPNIPADDVPPGGKENNEVVRTWGEKPTFNFDPKDHVDLVTSLRLIDYERGVKMGGTGFWLYIGDGARLEWALLNYFVDTHINDGYEFILPPHILNEACGFAAGQFPKFSDDVFHLKTGDGKVQFLLPTSETALINFHRDEIIPEEELPKKYFSYTPCYRKEAGSYRAQERGMIRGHQFNKIEMFQFTRSEYSENALEELIDKAEQLVQGLGLHHQVSKLAAQDASASMAKTYDIEVWIPSMNEYKEVSSASNASDYQARRGSIRLKRTKTGKNELVHTLNASGLATSRIIPAIVEQFQNEDGSVTIPEVLRPYLGGKEVFEPVE